MYRLYAHTHMHICFAGHCHRGHLDIFATLSGIATTPHKYNDTTATATGAGATFLGSKQIRVIAANMMQSLIIRSLKQIRCIFRDWLDRDTK